MKSSTSKPENFLISHFKTKIKVNLGFAMRRSERLSKKPSSEAKEEKSAPPKKRPFSKKKDPKEETKNEEAVPEISLFKKGSSKKLPLVEKRNSEKPRRKPFKDAERWH